MGISGQFSGTTSARGTQCRSFLGVEGRSLRRLTFPPGRSSPFKLVLYNSWRLSFTIASSRIVLTM